MEIDFALVTQRIQEARKPHGLTAEALAERVNHFAVEGAWSQRIYGASIDDFYCGYRGAVSAIIDAVMPLGRESVQISRIG